MSYIEEENEKAFFDIFFLYIFFFFLVLRGCWQYSREKTNLTFVERLVDT